LFEFTEMDMLSWNSARCDSQLKRILSAASVRLFCEPLEARRADSPSTPSSGERIQQIEGTGARGMEIEMPLNVGEDSDQNDVYPNDDGYKG